MRLLRWFIVNSAFLGILVYAIYYNSDWAYNLIIFFIWVYGILSVLIVLNKDILKEMQESVKEKKLKPIPKWLDLGYDLLFISVLAANGWYWSAVLWLIQIGAVAKIYKHEDADNRI